jgi:division protein CdvB (Snf7/Vps24/ESCRT-III family)
MNNESPRCVSQLAIVRFDESISKIEWNDSFSSFTWTTKTIDLKSAPAAVGDKKLTEQQAFNSRLQQVRHRLQRLKEQRQEKMCKCINLH